MKLPLRFLINAPWNPKSSYRRLCLIVRIPVGRFAPHAITDALDVWAALAGITLLQRGLRHSVALHRLRQDEPLTTIGDLQGHRTAESTRVYLRPNIEDLLDIAPPLPRTPAAEEIEARKHWAGNESSRGKRWHK